MINLCMLFREWIFVLSFEKFLGVEIKKKRGIAVRKLPILRMTKGMIIHKRNGFLVRHNEIITLHL